MLPHVGPMELIVVLAIALLIFGPKALPSLGKSIGGGIRNLKAGLNAKDGDVEREEEAEADRLAEERVKRKAARDAAKGDSTPA